MTRAERRRAERENKMAQTRYEYTNEQIEQIKNQAVAEAAERIKAKTRAEIDKHIDEEWRKREEFFSGADETERMQKALCLLMSVPVKILCEDFGWKSPRWENDMHNKLWRFVDAVIKEVNRVSDDQSIDIRRYGEEVTRKYGIEFVMQDLK